MNVVLIGFMATGKSTIGRELGHKLNLPVIDMDREVRKQFGLTIPEVFEQHGEPAFRAKETEFLEHLVEEQSADYKQTRLFPRSFVLSTGGGAPVAEKNRELLRRLGHVVWLRARPETIAARCRPHVDRRPVLSGHENNLEEHVRSLLADREPYYEQAANSTIWTDDETDAVAIAAAIRKLLR
jgi:shikimate kinase